MRSGRLELLTLGLGFAILYLLLRREEGAHRAICVMVGTLWIWLAWAFFWERYATINWAVAYVAPFIVIEGFLLIWLGAIGTQPIFTSSRKAADLSALALFAFALVCYPLLAPLTGRSWLSGEIFGVAPDPTALATLALLALAEGRFKWLAMVVPMLWCAISTMTLWTMGASDFFVPLAGALAAIGIAFMRQR